MAQTIPVGMGEMRIASSPDALAVYGIGSCVIVAMYEAEKKLGGIVHVMLPDSSGIDPEILNPVKFADTAVPLLLKKMEEGGAAPEKISAKIAGGAEMFPPTEDFASKVGSSNVVAVKDALKKLKIPVVAEDLGGSRGRSIEFELENGTIILTILGEEEKEL